MFLSVPHTEQIIFNLLPMNTMAAAVAVRSTHSIDDMYASRSLLKMSTSNRSPSQTSDAESSASAGGVDSKGGPSRRDGALPLTSKPPTPKSWTATLIVTISCNPLIVRLALSSPPAGGGHHAAAAPPSLEGDDPSTTTASFSLTALRRIGEVVLASVSSACAEFHPPSRLVAATIGSDRARKMRDAATNLPATSVEADTLNREAARLEQHSAISNPYDFVTLTTLAYNTVVFSMPKEVYVGEMALCSIQVSILDALTNPANAPALSRATLSGWQPIAVHGGSAMIPLATLEAVNRGDAFQPSLPVEGPFVAESLVFQRVVVVSAPQVGPGGDSRRRTRAGEASHDYSLLLGNRNEEAAIDVVLSQPPQLPRLLAPTIGGLRVIERVVAAVESGFLRTWDTDSYGRTPLHLLVDLAPCFFEASEIAAAGKGGLPFPTLLRQATAVSRAALETGSLPTEKLPIELKAPYRALEGTVELLLEMAAPVYRCDALGRTVLDAIAALSSPPDLLPPTTADHPHGANHNAPLGRLSAPDIRQFAQMALVCAFQRFADKKDPPEAPLRRRPESAPDDVLEAIDRGLLRFVSAGGAVDVPTPLCHQCVFSATRPNIAIAVVDAPPSKQQLPRSAGSSSMLSAKTGSSPSPRRGTLEGTASSSSTTGESTVRVVIIDMDMNSTSYAADRPSDQQPAAQLPRVTSIYDCNQSTPQTTNRTSPAAARSARSLRVCVLPYHPLTHPHTFSDVLLLSNGVIVAVDYTLPEDRWVQATCQTGLQVDVFAGESTGYCCHFTPSSTHTAANDDTTAAATISGTRLLLPDEEQAGDRLDSVESRPDVTPAADSRFTFGNSLLLHRDDAVVPLADAVSQEAPLGGGASPLLLTGSVAASHSSTRQPLLLGTLVYVCNGVLRALHLPAASFGFNGPNATMPLAQRAAALAVSVRAALQWLQADSLGEAEAYAARAQVAATGAFAASYHEVLPCLITACASCTTSGCTFVALPQRRLLCYNPAAAQFFEVSDPAAASSAPAAGSLDGTDVQAVDVPTSLQYHPRGRAVTWAGKSIIAVHHKVAPDDDPAVAGLLPCRALFKVEDCERDTEVTCVAASAPSWDPDAVYFTRRGVLCRTAVTTAGATGGSRPPSQSSDAASFGEVVLLMHMTLTPSELQARVSHGDEGSAAPSGAQLVSFNVDGSRMLRYSPVTRCATIAGTQPLQRMVIIRCRSVCAENKRPLVHGGLELLHDPRLAPSVAPGARHSIPKERFVASLCTLSTLDASDALQISHAIDAMAALGCAVRPGYPVRPTVGPGGTPDTPPAAAAILAQNRTATVSCGRNAAFDVNSCDADGRTPMHIVGRALSRSLLEPKLGQEFMAHLLRLGAAPGLPDREGTLSCELLLASPSGRVATAEYVKQHFIPAIRSMHSAEPSVHVVAGDVFVGCQQVTRGKEGRYFAVFPGASLKVWLPTLRRWSTIYAARNSNRQGGDDDTLTFALLDTTGPAHRKEHNKQRSPADAAKGALAADAQVECGSSDPLAFPDNVEVLLLPGGPLIVVGFRGEPQEALPPCVVALPVPALEQMSARSVFLGKMLSLFLNQEGAETATRRFECGFVAVVPSGGTTTASMTEQSMNLESLQTMSRRTAFAVTAVGFAVEFAMSTSPMAKDLTSRLPTSLRADASAMFSWPDVCGALLSKAPFNTPLALGTLLALEDSPCGDGSVDVQHIAIVPSTPMCVTPQAEAMGRGRSPPSLHTTARQTATTQSLPVGASPVRNHRGGANPLSLFEAAVRYVALQFAAALEEALLTGEASEASLGAGATLVAVDVTPVPPASENGAVPVAAGDPFALAPSHVAVIVHRSGRNDDARSSVDLLLVSPPPRTNAGRDTTSDGRPSNASMTTAGPSDLAVVRGGDHRSNASLNSRAPGWWRLRLPSASRRGPQSDPLSLRGSCDCRALVIARDNGSAQYIGRRDAASPGPYEFFVALGGASIVVLSADITGLLTDSGDLSCASVRSVEFLGASNFASSYRRSSTNGPLTVEAEVRLHLPSPLTSTANHDLPEGLANLRERSPLAWAAAPMWPRAEDDRRTSLTTNNNTTAPRSVWMLIFLREGYLHGFADVCGADLTALRCPGACHVAGAYPRANRRRRCLWTIDACTLSDAELDVMKRDGDVPVNVVHATALPSTAPPAGWRDALDAGGDVEADEDDGHGSEPHHSSAADPSSAADQPTIRRSGSPTQARMSTAILAGGSMTLSIAGDGALLRESAAHRVTVVTPPDWLRQRAAEGLRSRLGLVTDLRQHVAPPPAVVDVSWNGVLQSNYGFLTCDAPPLPPWLPRPPRTELLRGTFQRARLSNSVASVEDQRAFLERIAAAIEQGILPVRQCDADGRTPFHLWADIAPFLPRATKDRLAKRLLSLGCHPHLRLGTGRLGSTSRQYSTVDTAYAQSPPLRRTLTRLLLKNAAALSSASGTQEGGGLPLCFARGGTSSRGPVVGCHFVEAAGEHVAAAAQGPSGAVSTRRVISATWSPSVEPPPGISQGAMHHTSSSRGMAAASSVLYLMLDDGSVDVMVVEESSGRTSIQPLLPPSVFRSAFLFGGKDDADAAVGGAGDAIAVSTATGAVSLFVTTLRPAATLGRLRRRGNRGMHEANVGSARDSAATRRRPVSDMTFALTLVPEDILLFSNGDAFVVRDPSTERTVMPLTPAPAATDSNFGVDDAFAEAGLLSWWSSVTGGAVFGHAPLQNSVHHGGIAVHWFDTIHTAPALTVGVIARATRDGCIAIQRLYPPAGCTAVFSRHLPAMLANTGPVHLDVPLLVAISSGADFSAPGSRGISRFSSMRSFGFGGGGGFASGAMVPPPSARSVASEGTAATAQFQSLAGNLGDCYSLQWVRPDVSWHAEASAEEEDASDVQRQAPHRLGVDSATASLSDMPMGGFWPPTPHAGGAPLSFAPYAAAASETGSDPTTIQQTGGQASAMGLGGGPGGNDGQLCLLVINGRYGNRWSLYRCPAFELVHQWDVTSLPLGCRQRSAAWLLHRTALLAAAQTFSGGSPGSPHLRGSPTEPTSAADRFLALGHLAAAEPPGRVTPTDSNHRGGYPTEGHDHANRHASLSSSSSAQRDRDGGGVLAAPLVAMACRTAKGQPGSLIAVVTAEGLSTFTITEVRRAPLSPLSPLVTTAAIATPHAVSPRSERGTTAPAAFPPGAARFQSTFTLVPDLTPTIDGYYGDALPEDIIVPGQSESDSTLLFPAPQDGGRLIGFDVRSGLLDVVGRLDDVPQPAFAPASLSSGDRTVLVSPDGTHVALLNLHRGCLTLHQLRRGGQPQDPERSRPALVEGWVGPLSALRSAQPHMSDDGADAPERHAASTAAQQHPIAVVQGVALRAASWRQTWFLKQQSSVVMRTVDSWLRLVGRDALRAPALADFLMSAGHAMQMLCFRKVLSALQRGVLEGDLPPHAVDADGRTAAHYVAVAILLAVSSVGIDDEFLSAANNSWGSVDEPTAASGSPTSYVLSAYVDHLLSDLLELASRGASLFVCDHVSGGHFRPCDYLVTALNGHSEYALVSAAPKATATATTNPTPTTLLQRFLLAVSGRDSLRNALQATSIAQGGASLGRGVIWRPPRDGQSTSYGRDRKALLCFGLPADPSANPEENSSDGRMDCPCFPLTTFEQSSSKPCVDICIATAAPRNTTKSPAVKHSDIAAMLPTGFTKCSAAVLQTPFGDCILMVVRSHPSLPTLTCLTTPAALQRRMPPKWIPKEVKSVPLFSQAHATFDCCKGGDEKIAFVAHISVVVPSHNDACPDRLSSWVLQGYDLRQAISQSIATDDRCMAAAHLVANVICHGVNDAGDDELLTKGVPSKESPMSFGVSESEFADLIEQRCADVRGASSARGDASTRRKSRVATLSQSILTSRLTLADVPMAASCLSPPASQPSATPTQAENTTVGGGSPTHPSDAPAASSDAASHALPSLRTQPPTVRKVSTVRFGDEQKKAEASLHAGPVAETANALLPTPTANASENGRPRQAVRGAKVRHLATSSGMIIISLEVALVVPGTANHAAAVAGTKHEVAVFYSGSGGACPTFHRAYLATMNDGFYSAAASCDDSTDPRLQAGGRYMPVTQAVRHLGSRGQRSAAHREITGLAAVNMNPGKMLVTAPTATRGDSDVASPSGTHPHHHRLVVGFEDRIAIVAMHAAPVFVHEIVAGMVPAQLTEPMPQPRRRSSTTVPRTASVQPPGALRTPAMDFFISLMAAEGAASTQVWTVDFTPLALLPVYRTQRVMQLCVAAAELPTWAVWPTADASAQLPGEEPREPLNVSRSSCRVATSGGVDLSRRPPVLVAMTTASDATAGLGTEHRHWLVLECSNDDLVCRQVACGRIDAPSPPPITTNSNCSTGDTTIDTADHPAEPSMLLRARTTCEEEQPSGPHWRTDFALCFAALTGRQPSEDDNKPTSSAAHVGVMTGDTAFAGRHGNAAGDCLLDPHTVTWI